MPAHRFSPPPQAQVQVTDPYYGDYSALAQQFLKTKNHPVYSAGQGIADALGDVGEAYFDKKALDKARAQQKQDYSDAAMAQQIAGNPDLTRNEAARRATQGGLDGGPQMTMASQVFDQPATVNQRDAAGMGALANNPRMALEMRPDIQAMAQQFAPPSFSGTLKPGEHAFAKGRDVASLPAAPPDSSIPLPPEVEAQRIRIAKASRPPAAEKVPQTHFAFDRVQKQNRSVTPQEEAAEPQRYAPVIANPMVEAYDPKTGNKVGSFDQSDPTFKARVESGELSTQAPRQQTDAEKRSMGFASRAKNALDDLQRVYAPDKETGKPTNLPSSGFLGGLQSTTLPFTNASVVPKVLQGKSFEQERRAKMEFMTAVLRKDSGATIKPDEYQEMDQIYFPQAGEGDQVIADKSKARENAMAALSAEATPGNQTMPAGRGASGAWSAVEVK